MAKKKTPPKKVESLSHKDKRKNIPTKELRDFVEADERSPEIMLYPRDPSLDPQLVWKEKDKQDSEDLAVPVVPVYIQEKIHPKAIIDALPRIEEQDDGQINLFDDFNGGPVDFEQKVEFYQHEQNWSNRLILGDSLLVMASLAEKEGLKGKVQMIYLDPPYGIKFGSNWQVSTRKRNVTDGRAEDATREPEQVRAYRDTWRLGIHSYLSYLRDRLVIVRDLLTETGSVFVQIGDENVHLVRCMMDEVFGSENFCGLIAFRTTGGQSAGLLSTSTDFLLWYSKKRKDAGKLNVKFRQPVLEKLGGAEEASGQYNWIEPKDRSAPPHRMTKDEEGRVEELREYYRLLRPDNLFGQGSPSDPEDYEFEFEGKTYRCPTSNHWKPGVKSGGMTKLAKANRLVAIGKTLSYLRYVDDYPVYEIDNVWNDTTISGYGRKKQYVVETSTKVIERCLLMTTDPGDLVLDPTCGSGTSAVVCEQWGRRWITCDTSRVALALTRTRLMSIKYPYYLLVDSPEGEQKEMRLSNQVPTQQNSGNDIRKGFVCMRVPHITLSSIVNNPEIKEGMTQQDIDEVISRNADTEILHDKPYVDNKRIRVSGPFSVESLSPHRVLSTADEDMNGTVTEKEAQKQQDFVTTILENLLKAGVQNTRKKERLVFDRLEPYAGKWIHAAGEYTDANGKVQRVAVSIGPEHGTVGPQQVKEAAKKAVQGIGFDTLIVCGFAFDPHVSEEAKRYGKLTVLPTKMNPDLAMSDELLKKTGAGNLFMVFGEPDIEIKTQKDGNIVVKINGVDVYDPTTGQVRSSSTDDIACWFIDTDYNGESFFVRHAYFTGDDEPYEKLKKALKAEIDEEAWNSLYRTESRPFAIPESGKIAIKVINHYGDEVIEVYEV
jgi:adenine-specific DNA-methyltransferase